MTEKRSDKRKILNSLAIVAGILLIAGAVGISVAKADFSVKKSAAQIVSEFEAIIPTRHRALPEAHIGNMPSAEISGEDFVGLLEIEEYALVLPVGSDWNEQDDERYPSAYRGSIYDRDLIIGGDNREGQFAFADSIDIGSVIKFTDLFGREFWYEVSMVNHADSIDSVQSGDDDLTLFSESRSTSKYVIIRCRLSNM